MKKLAVIVTVVTLTFGLTGCGHFKKFGKSVGHNTKHVTKTVGHASRDAAKGIKHAVKA